MNRKASSQCVGSATSLLMSSRPRRSGTPLATRFLVYYAVTYLILIAALGWFVERQVRDALLEDLVAGAVSTAKVARLGMPTELDRLDGWSEEVFEESGLRVTVIQDDGVVVGDSHSDPAVMENHSNRPEVIAAEAGEIGQASRVSLSTGFAQVYVALPPEDGLVLRVSVSERSVAERLSPIRLGILTASLLVGLIGVFVVAVVARRLARPIVNLSDTTLAIAAGGLDVRPERSSVAEVNELGQAISQLAEDLGQRLVQSELATETLEVVLGALPQGTLLVDSDESVAYANSRMAELIGQIPESLSGLTPHPFQTAVRDARESGEKVDVTVEYGTPAKQLRGMATPFIGDQRILLVVVDVTDRERVASIRRDFVANASHELKTPVSSIIASADALSIAVERGDGSAVTFARNVEASARQLDRLVSDLLDLSRLEREEPELDPVRVDLLVREEVDRFQDTASEAGVELTVESEAVQALANWRDLSIAVRNLLDNAVRYTQPGGSVVASVGSDEGSAVVRVTDTGTGVPTRDLERIFERFYRVDAARSRRTGGTGLGLAIVKHVVESHGGLVEAQSELDVGSTFTIRLPLA